jgi:hypothetical protein
MVEHDEGEYVKYTDVEFMVHHLRIDIRQPDPATEVYNTIAFCTGELFEG